MARIVKEYDERYTEFLEVARQLFYQQGYEWTSVQTIIEKVGVAKGTFYHYFDSKADLLDALVARMVQETMGLVEPLMEDETLDAVARVEQFFIRTVGWKAENKDFLLEIVRVLYEDKNVLLRSKMQREGLALVAPVLASLIRQGMEEGVFRITQSPDVVAGIVLSMVQSLSEGIAFLLLAEPSDRNGATEAEQRVIAYERSIERVLGAAEGTLHLFNLEDIRVWFE